MPDDLSNRGNPSSFFLEKVALASGQRRQMVETFAQAHLEIKRVLAAIGEAYPKFAVKETEDRISHKFPYLTYQVLNLKETDKTENAFTLKIAVIANPDRHPKKGAPRLPGLQTGNMPLMVLVVDIGDTTYYGAQLLQTRYRLDRQGGFDAFVSDLGLYCGIVYDGETPKPLMRDPSALKPTGRIFGLANKPEI